MLDNTFHRGSEPAAGIDYGLSEFNHKGERRSIAPRLIHGDPEDVKAAVNTLRCRQRYTAGVLSFAEKDVPDALKHRIIREHLAVCFPGIDAARIAACYIQHQDEGFLELHYWHANTDLLTGKRVNGYYHRIDRKPRRLWVQTVNARFNLADPDDPKRWRLVVPPKKYAPESHQTMQQKVLGSLVKMAQAGAVQCRADIEAALVKAGWTISRRTRRFISITHARLNKPIRLSGKMFAVDWTGAVPEDVIEQLSRAFRAARVQRLRTAVAELTPLLEQRATYNTKRYGGDHPVQPLIHELASAAESLAVQEAALEAVQPSDVRAPSPGRKSPVPPLKTWRSPWKSKTSTTAPTPASNEDSPNFSPTYRMR